MVSAVIRSARQSELADLAVLEIEAGQLFRTVDLALVAGHVPDQEALRRSHERGLVWVGEQHGTVAGYIVARVVDGNAHIEQVSVSPAYARQGVGRRLISHVEEWGRCNDRSATTLTTFRDVPWNGPYYEKLGYRELLAVEIGSELAAALAHEASLPGIDASRRCAMIRRNDGA
jgi:ribosomal protein S18 acetylase RimI-like enzyme